VADIPELELREIRFVRGGYEALSGVSLVLSPGETLFVMGGAGSGKSILIKTAAGIALPDSGDVLFRGRSLARMSTREEAAFRRASGFAFQDAALWSNQTLFDNLALPIRLHEPGWGKAEVERAVHRAADLVGCGQELRLRPAELSVGERKLVGLARAIVLDPELLFLDDPTSSLDEAAVARVAEIIEALKKRGRSVFVASAVSDLASRCADSVAVLLNGAFAARGVYDEAVAWTDPNVRAITGRLKPRASVPAWVGGLAGAWAEAIAEDETIAEDTAAWDTASHKGKPKREASGDGSTLSDFINAVPGDDSEPDGQQRGKP
jgi:phospholipid/cholesterol/gamma-HCH transport system ATP-binding protein